MSVQHFHKGELHLQEQTGMRARIDVLTQHMMRSSMPDEHRLFYEGLEYILIGTIGADGLPYASMVTGAPGFASSPDPDTLVIRTGARNDLPAFAALRVGERQLTRGRFQAITTGLRDKTVIRGFLNSLSETSDPPQRTFRARL